MKLIQVVQSSFSANGIYVSKPFCKSVYEYYSHAEAYTVYPDVIPCLDQLSRANVTMGIMSDFDERLDVILKELGLRTYFKFIVQSYVEGWSKPSKELWAAAVEKGGVGGEAAWHVGDDVKKDTFVDATSILLDRNGTSGILRITSLVQLPSILNIHF